MSNIEFTDHISVSDYIELRKTVDFKTLSHRQAEAALKNYVFLIVAKSNDKPVGMTRLIFDGAYIAVLVDVIVLPEYQGHGIGKTMIEKALAYLKNNIANGEQVLVMLMCAKGKEGFYEKMGFIKRPDETYGAGMSQWLLK
ncbi:MAG: GNAT family N-acetyltransferase [Nitrososphaerota archaeon]|jgi:GNAT superfamily N-acetyltransferase|nr:GNAT family N-acetyltransferase [Nitrososphaerota archaeon]